MGEQGKQLLRCQNKCEVPVAREILFQKSYYQTFFLKFDACKVPVNVVMG